MLIKQSGEVVNNMIIFARKHLLLILFAFIVVLGVVFSTILLNIENKSEEGIWEVVNQDQVFSIEEDLESDYSELDEIVPGKSTREDVERINGLPFSIFTSDSEMYMYYNTPSEIDQNIVFLRNRIVVHVLENVYSDYRGIFSNFVDKYGDRPLILYSEETEFPWYIWLDNGIAVESSNNIDISKILYFVPQSTTRFVVRIAPSLNLVASLEEHIENFLVDGEFEEFLINEEGKELLNKEE